MICNRNPWSLVALVGLMVLVLASCATTPDPALVAERDAALDQARKAELALARARESLGEAESSLAGLRAELDRLRSSNTALSAQSEENLALISDKLARLADLESQRDRFSRELEGLRLALGSAESALDADRRSYQATIEALDQDRRAQLDRINALARDLESARSELAEALVNLDRLRREKEGLLPVAEEVATLRQALARSEQRERQLEAELEAERVRLQAAARAISVLRFFQDRTGIDGSRLVATSFGEYRPVAPNDSETSKRANRRVTIVLINPPVYETR